ncbi:MAG: GNAT family N-acetyltransferase [Desulfovibrio sp.]|uniref:GNAT family N-acetyltransferase n=1 Tax=Desulfovibrio sp. TaxID=885 RepID=UPI0039E6BF84
MKSPPHTSTPAGATLLLRPALATDHAALADLWKRSVLATHHFLTPLAVDELYTALLQEYLPGVEELWLAEYGQSLPEMTDAATPDKDSATASEDAEPSAHLPHPVGFMGFNWPQIEMLFVEPEFFGHGIGKALLALTQRRAIAEGATLTLDVNEQNPSGLAFYERMGFAVTGRSPVDGQGRPYPLLHMEWRQH